MTTSVPKITPVLIEKPCPDCKKQTVQLSGNSIQCTACDFSINYTCLYCNRDTLAPCHSANSIPMLQCGACKQYADPQKIAGIIDNNLLISHDNRCSNCQSVTLYPDGSEQAYRCLKFPSCIGQASLLDSAEPESLVFLDFETTGLDMGSDDVIEIGATKLDKTGHMHQFQTLIQTQHNLSDTIQRLTGITPDMLETAMPSEQAFSELIHFIGGATVVVHNADFDIPWLLIMAQRHGLVLSLKSIICTLEWAKKNQEGRCSLEVLAKKYAIHNPQAHRALADALTTQSLYFCFRNTATVPAPRRLPNQYATLVRRYA